MSSKNKKLTVLHQLSKEAEPISLQELLEKLGSEYAERSVRRWLTEMIYEGLVKRHGHKRGTKYEVIQRAKREVGSVNRCFRPESIKVIKQVQRPLYDVTQSPMLIIGLTLINQM